MLGACPHVGTWHVYCKDCIQSARLEAARHVLLKAASDFEKEADAMPISDSRWMLRNTVVALRERAADLGSGDSGGEGVSDKQPSAIVTGETHSAAQAAEPPRPDPGYRMIPHEQYKHAIESAYSRGQHAERARVLPLVEHLVGWSALDHGKCVDCDAARAYMADAAQQGEK